MYCHLLHCSFSAVLRYPVWSSSVEYIHAQFSAVFISFISKVECSSVQISVARCSDCFVWYVPVQSTVVQCSAVWWSQAQPKTVQSSEVQCRPVQCSEVLSGSVQSSPLHWRAVQYIQWILRPSSPILFVPIQFHSLPSSSVHFNPA